MNMNEGKPEITNTERYNFAIETVKEAGELVLATRKEILEVNTKNGDDRDFVSNVDLKVNDWVNKKIAEAMPGDRVYSEESASSETGESFWSLDPIDGTSNFINDIPHYAVVMTYIEKGEPVLGAVYNPITRELFSFKKDQGVSLNGEPVHVRNAKTIKESVFLLHIGRKEEVREWGLKLENHFLSNAKKTGNLGSSALDLAYLAAGRVDAVVYGTMTTLDIATAIAMVRTAGGEVYGIEGNPVELRDTPQQIIATATPELFEEISKI